MNDIIAKLCSDLHATRAYDGLGRKFLAEEQHLLFALWLEDTQMNFRLMSNADLDRLGKQGRKKALREQRSPFECILLVFYTEDGKKSVFFKTINGMASLLDEKLTDLLKDPGNFRDIEPYNLIVHRAPYDPELPFY